MLESQRIQIRLSELRAEINGWPEDGDIDRLAQLRAESLDLEGKLRAAIQEEAHRMEPEEPIEGAPPQERELNAIYHRASLGRMMDHLALGSDFDGAEAEFRAAVFPDGSERQDIGNIIPMHMFLPLGRKSRCGPTLSPPWAPTAASAPRARSRPGYSPGRMPPSSAQPSSAWAPGASAFPAWPPGPP